MDAAKFYELNRQLLGGGLNSVDWCVMPCGTVEFVDSDVSPKPTWWRRALWFLRILRRPTHYRVVTKLRLHSASLVPMPPKPE